jgi:hypothetical protein
MMSLPEMTPLQALVVNVLFAGETTTRQLREELAFRGLPMPTHLLYRLLGRAELAGYICGKLRQWQLPDGRTVREKHYRVTPHGLDAWNKTIAFYAGMDPVPDHFQPVSIEQYLADA